MTNLRNALAGMLTCCLLGLAPASGAQSAAPVLGESDGLFNVKDFGAKNDGVTDDTSAIQSAIDKASERGGIVVIPVGRWLCRGHLEIKPGVHLTGMNVSPMSWEPALGSILLATEGRDDEQANPFIEMRTSTSLTGITIYYPEQMVDNIRAYPWTIQIRGNSAQPSLVSFDATIADVTLINSYNGIRTGPTENGRHRIIRVNGCVLRRGILVDWTGDIGRIQDVQFHSHFWAAAAFAGNWSSVFSYMQNHLEAFIFGRTDWEYVSNTFVFPANVGYRFIETANGACNGQFVGIGADATATAILVEAIQAQGLLITNGEFDSHMIGASTQIVIDKGSTGNVRFVNCGFWGPVRHNAVVRGDGFVSFSDCYFSNDEVTEDYSVDVEGGKVQIHDCTFGGVSNDSAPGHSVVGNRAAHRPPCIHLGPNVRSAIIIGNNGLGGVDVKNEIGHRAIIRANETAHAMVPGI